MTQAGGDDLRSPDPTPEDATSVPTFDALETHDSDDVDILDPLESSAPTSPATRVLRLGRSHVTGAVAGLVAVGAIASGVLSVGASEGAPVTTAPVVSSSAPTTTAVTSVPTTAQAPGLPGIPGLDAITAARMVSEALADSPLKTTAPTAQRIAAAPVSGAVPKRMLAAYQRGEKVAQARFAKCNLPWWLLAGIGRVESGHAAGGAVDAQGVTVSRILGPRLDGTTPGTATIADTDGGRLDGDALYDRAVGPMQFIPGTWAGAGIDGNGDGVADPNQVDDAASSAAGYLCSGGGDMTRPADMAAAILRYNNSQQYVEDVLAGAVAYRDGAVPVNPPRHVDGAPERPATSGSGSAKTPSSATTTAATGPSGTTAAGGPGTQTGARAGTQTGTGTAGTRTGTGTGTTTGTAGTATTGTSGATTGAPESTGTPAKTPATQTATKTPVPSKAPSAQTATKTPTTKAPATKNPAPTSATAGSPSVPLPTCRPAPEPEAEGATESPTASPTTSATTNGTEPGSNPTHTWDPDDPRIAHLPVCEEPATASASPAAGTSAAPGAASATTRAATR